MRSRKLLKLLSLMLACLLCFGFVACDSKDDTPSTDSDQDAPANDNADGQKDPDSNEEEKKEMVHKVYPLAETLESLKILGRTSISGTGITCDFTASGIEFCAYVEGEVKLHLSCTADTYFTVYVDGVRSEERHLVTPTDTTITVANFAEAGEHTIRVLKQTEAQYSLSVLNSLEMTGYWVDPPQERAYVEFIGDSISCGYGNLGSSAIPSANMSQPQYSDGTQAFAFMTAEKLNADCSVIGCGGIGLVTKGYCNFVESEFFTKQSYFRSATEEYSPTKTPDLVVINLGTNDQNYNVSSTDMIREVKALIALVRSTYGTDVLIVWCYNMMNEGMIDSIEEAFEDLGGQSNGLYLCELTRNRNGGAGHPNVEGHTTAAEELAAFIQKERLLR